MSNTTRMSVVSRALGVMVGLVGFFAYMAPAGAQAPEMVKVHRLFNPSLVDHLPTRDPSEGAPAYAWQGSVQMYSTPYGGAGNTPAPTNTVVRCYTGVRHYANGGACASGHSFEGVLGYVLANPREGHIGLYQCSTKHSWHFFPSTDPACEGGKNVGFFGYVRPDGAVPATANLSLGPDTRCLGRCGAGCDGWMPIMDIYTSQCLAHDECVLHHGHLNCMNGSLVAAAISYSVASNLTIVRAIGDAVKSVFNW
jgi:hypothetical protein